MFGAISRISWTFVFMFILFLFSVRSGVDYIIDVARAAAGKLIGGPGFIAVIGSGLMGSVSCSSVANTVSTDDQYSSDAKAGFLQDLWLRHQREGN